ncbi:MAG: cobalamin biosynthesis protein [Mycobacteriaceae bacterium]|nr:cobalamin biosynthesis protein [Mycobacteriaceae bacterium]
MFAPRSRAVAIAAGALADALVGDPHRGHPVALFGTAAMRLERATYRDSRWAGGLHTVALLAVLGYAGVVAQRAAPRTVVTAAATWAALGGTSLARTGLQIAELLSRDEVAKARRLLPSLCGRDPDVLDGEGLTSAALESVAENTSDAQVAPLLWAAVGGAPGVLVYRGLNTLDAMIGHRSPRYQRYGWAAARLDDLANLVPARVTAGLVAVCAPLVGGSWEGALRAWRHDARRHPSPNAGVVEAAFAGALGRRLGGPTQYAYGLEIRPTLGGGAPPTVSDLFWAVRLSQIVQVAALVVTIGALSVAGRSGRRACLRR